MKSLARANAAADSRGVRWPQRLMTGPPPLAIQSAAAKSLASDSSGLPARSRVRLG